MTYLSFGSPVMCVVTVYRQDGVLQADVEINNNVYHIYAIANNVFEFSNEIGRWLDQEKENLNA